MLRGATMDLRREKPSADTGKLAPGTASGFFLYASRYPSSTRFGSSYCPGPGFFASGITEVILARWRWTGVDK